MISKIPYIMFNFPTQDYSVKYCTDNGLLLGNIYFIIEQPDELNVFIKITDNKNTRVGKLFFKQHFKIAPSYIRKNKLKQLG